MLEGISKIRGVKMKVLRAGMPVEFLPGAKNVAPIALAGPLLISIKF